MHSQFNGAARVRRPQAAVLPRLLFALALSLPALAPAAGLTLAEAQKLALGRSLLLRAQAASAAASRELAVAARQLPDPMLKASIQNLPVTGPDRYSVAREAMTMRRLGIEQELTSGAKRALRAERYERLADQARAEQVVDAAAIERDTALAWLDLYYAGQMAQLVAEQGRQADAEVVAAEGAYRSGRGSRADLLAARSAAALVRDRGDAIERRRANARITLMRWTGEQPDLAPLGAPDISHIRHDATTLPSQLDHHPEVSVLNRAAEVAATEARLADAESRPDWKLEFAYEQRGPNYPNMVSFGLSVPLQWDRKQRQERDIAATLALAEQARDVRDEALRMHTAQTRALIGEWRTGLQRLARYRSELVPLEAERVQALLASYRGGKAALADVLAARTHELDTGLQALQLEFDTARLWARLNFLFPTSQMNTFSTTGQQGAQ